MREMLNVFRIVFAVVWIFLGAALLGREALLPPELYARYDPKHLNLIGALGFIVGGYNALRIYLNWRKGKRRVETSPPRVRRTPSESEYNPDLDFEKKGEAGK